MNAVNNEDANNQTNWPRRKEKKVKKKQFKYEMPK
jgi:hypothetical protein